MTTCESNKHSLRRQFIWVLMMFVLVVVAMLAFQKAFYQQPGKVPAETTAFVERLKSAKHFQSDFPAQRQTIDLAKRSSFRDAALNAIGLELRDVRSMTNGSPEIVFVMLSHLGGFGEIIWVDQWTNFPVKLPPGQGDVPRRDAVVAALDSIEASGGCLIKAGANRYLVARKSEKEGFEAAIRELGWLDGHEPPWVVEDRNNRSKSEDGAANGSQPIRSETNRTSSAAGCRR